MRGIALRRMPVRCRKMLVIRWLQCWRMKLTGNDLANELEGGMTLVNVLVA